jgi:hypothetical protein
MKALTPALDPRLRGDDDKVLLWLNAKSKQGMKVFASTERAMHLDSCRSGMTLR